MKIRQNGTEFSVGTAGDWNKKGDIELFKKTYSDFEPAVIKMVNSVKAEDLLVWKLVQLPDLESWTWKSGKVVLTADGKFLTTSSNYLV